MGIDPVKMLLIEIVAATPSPGLRLRPQLKSFLLRPSLWLGSEE